MDGSPEVLEAPEINRREDARSVSVAHSYIERSEEYIERASREPPRSSIYIVASQSYIERDLRRVAKRGRGGQTPGALQPVQVRYPFLAHGSPPSSPPRRPSP